MTDQPPTIDQSTRGRAAPLRGADARLAANMTASLAVPTATSFRELDVAHLVAERVRFNAALTPRKLSFTHFLAYAVAQAAAVHPALAAHYEEREGTPFKVEPVSIGLGLAVDVVRADGSRLLLVPVLRTAESLDFAAFVTAYDDLIARARILRLAPDEMAGPDLTLTNPGSLGTYASVPRLMPGQGAIVATGVLRKTVEGDHLMVSCTYDHRIITGAQSALFLTTLEEFLAGADGFYADAAAALGVPTTPLVGPVMPDPSVHPPESGVSRRTIAAAAELLDAWRAFGHRAARLDPLGSDPPGDPALDPATYGLDEPTLAAIDATAFPSGRPDESAAAVLADLQRAYGGVITYEFEHLDRHEERAWLRAAVEEGVYDVPLAPPAQRALLDHLSEIEAFEQFLGRAYLGQTRFSLEGLDTLLPLLAEFAELAAGAGIRALKIGMAHRGRLNVLAHLVGVPYGDIIADFASDRDEARLVAGEPSDVRYHRGATGTKETAAGPIAIAVLPNPSHLEAIDPVLLGAVRAQQTDRTVPPEGQRDTAAALAVMVHGDASFAAQGVVAETFNLARLPGYTVGGALHVIANNQVGFTTPPTAGRSTDYASDLAKGFDVPVVHVNADEPEAVLAAARLAFAYRARFGGDFVIDLVGYRRLGHNEGDEPAYTQPLMYAAIASHPTARALYAARLVAAGVITDEETKAMSKEAWDRLASAADETARPKQMFASPQYAIADRSPVTGVAAERLSTLEVALAQAPAGFTIHPKLVPQFARRHEAMVNNGPITWAQAEALALASLLQDGVPVRLSGQDTVRGTFSQRHLVLHDALTGATYMPLAHTPDAKAAVEAIDSPLSEYACMGFEYGYAVAAPEALVCWEAQFGDFANSGEVIIDQFFIAGEAKWNQRSRLTLLLPHGYEGQGPEHSSARIERFLALGAEGNIRAAQPSTPAQYFHLLRDQALRLEPRHLVVFTPKSLLRLPAAASSVKALTEGSFRSVLDDPFKDAKAKVHHLILCSGRLYYDLAEAAARDEATAVIRLEMLYPFPERELRQLLENYPEISRVTWAQDEPYNLGPRKFVVPLIKDLLPDGVTLRVASRPERSSPAEGRAGEHQAEQRRIIVSAMSKD